VAGLLLSTAGVALAWNSSTPWLGFFGITAAMAGGFLAHSVRWELAEDAQTAIRYLRERAFGVVLAVLGACVLAGYRTAVSFADGAHLVAGGGPAWQNSLGAFCLAGGLFLQLQPFPLLGSALGQSSARLPARVLLARLYPAWAAFAILFRFEPDLRAVGIFPVSGWIALGSAVLSAFAGLLQSDYGVGFSLWISTLFSLAITVLSFSGQQTAFPVLLCAILGAFVLSMSAGALELGGGPSQPHRKRAITAKTVATVAALAGTGFAGFSSSGAFVNWLGEGWGRPPVLALEILAVFLSCALGWKILFQVCRSGIATRAGWGTLLAPVFPLLLSLALFMDGTLSGGLVPDSPDTVMSPVLKVLFPATDAAGSAAHADFPAPLAVYLGSLLVAAVAAYFLSKKTKAVDAGFPKLGAFIRSGYGVDWLAERVTAALRTVGAKGEAWIGGTFWNRWLPTVVERGLGASSRAVSGADRFASEKGAIGIARAAEVPAKILQLVQNGDVQWYLFFGIGAGLALLAHFLMVRG
jgi:hypothetical protein